MNIGSIQSKEFLSTTNEKNIFLYYFNQIEINSREYHYYDLNFKNYILNYNLYNFYIYFFSFILQKTTYNVNNIRTTLLKQKLLNRINTRILFFHNRMLQSNPQFLNCENNSVFTCV